MRRALAAVVLLALFAWPTLRASYAPLPEYSLEFGSGGSTGFNAADGDVRYFGIQGGAAALTTADSGHALMAPITGTIVRAYGSEWINGTLGSNEAVTITIRNVTANTTSNITTSTTWDAQERAFSNTAMSMAVTAGDALLIKVTCPTWATNPTQAFVWVRLVMR